MKKSYLLFSLPILFSSCINKTDIENLNTKISHQEKEITDFTTSMKEEIKNQTSLFYRTIGEVIPIEIPEDIKFSFETLNTSAKNLKENITHENLIAVTDLYKSFIKSTEPWVQEYYENALAEIKSIIDYSSIIDTYNNDNDENMLTYSLQSFISSNSNYSEISNVVKYYNSLVDKQNNEYSKKIETLKDKLNSVCNKKASSTEIIETLDLITPYIEDENLQSLLSKYEEYLEDAQKYETVLLNIESLDKAISSTMSSPDSNILKILIEKYAESYVDVYSITKIENETLIKKLDQSSKKLDDLSEKITGSKVSKSQDEILIDDISKTLNACQESIDGLLENNNSSILIPILKEQLYNSYFSSQSLNNPNQEIIKRIAALQTKVSEIENSIKAKEESEFLKQISDSVAVIKRTINTMTEDENSLAMINIITSQLATYTLSASEITLVENKTVLNEIQTVKNLLDSKNKKITDAINKKDENAIKNYNRQAMNRIEKSKNDNDGIGTWDSDKSIKREKILLSMEEINQSYLYVPVANIYNQVYSEIWNKLNQNEQFQVAKSSINITKKGINEYF